MELISDVNIKSLNTKKTKKEKKDKKTSKENLKKVWDLFDKEISDKKEPLECVYRNVSNEYEYEMCTSCNSNLFINEDGLNVCPNKKCGIIYKNSLDQTAEWRFYGNDDSHGSDPTRCGMPINPLLKESSFSCKILCPAKTSYEMYKIKRYTDWYGMPYKEKSQYDEFQLITNLSNIAGIPKLIIDDAIRFHKQISETKTFRGLNRDGIIAASIYISSRVNNYPRTAKEIADIFNLDNTSATRGCKNAITIINEIQRSSENNDLIELNKTTPLSFIERYCSKLNINNELTKLCKFISHKIEKNNIIPENTPHSIAGGIIYFVSQVCNLNITKLSINNISKISEVTINKCYKKLEQHKDILIPECIIKKYSN